MIKAFRAGYLRPGGKPLPQVLGGIAGMLSRTTAQTVVVVVVLRWMGVL